MATEVEDSRLEKLTHTKKFEKMVACEDLYSLPVTAVPGCGFLLGILLKRENIYRASDLYAIFKKNKNNFGKYLSCKFGSWNTIYARTVIRAFEDWEKANAAEPEKKPTKEPQEKKKGPPRKVGLGSKKWTEFLMRPDLGKTSVRYVPGVASILASELNKRGFCTAQQLMDQYKGEKKGQCRGSEEHFYKWILCCFGYWNTLYSKTVLAALKAYDEGHDGPAPLVVPVEPKTEPGGAEDDESGDEAQNKNKTQDAAEEEEEEATPENENRGETLMEKVVRLAEDAAEEISAVLDENEAEVNGGGDEARAAD